MKRLLPALALIAACAAALPGWAQERPPLRLVVGFPAGAALDTLTRLVAEKMKVSLARPVIVENRPGAGGMVATEALKTTAPDGNTVLVSPVANISIAPHTYPNLRYNALTDFEAVAHLADFQIAFGVNAEVPAANMNEYVALVRKEPAKYGNYASAAAGSLPHFFGILVARTAGVEMTHVP
jgi:tripartite-type tricarboxylate transporter receptor subunit TctC